jgi:hypothetical protein
LIIRTGSCGKTSRSDLILIMIFSKVFSLFQGLS